MEESQIIALIRLLDDEDPEVAQHVRQQLRMLGADALPYLRDFQTELQPDTPLHKEVTHFIQYHQLDDLTFRLQQWQEEEPENLLKGLWLVNTYAEPGLKLSDVRKKVEQLYYDVWLDFHVELNPIEQIRLLNNIFFGKLGFTPNTQHFYAPENSFIAHTLQSRTGNPIGLCSLYLLVAQKFQLPVHGVNLPNLFVLMYKTEKRYFYINAFNRGLTFTQEEALVYLQRLGLKPKAEYLEPTTAPVIIRRTLNNLSISYQKLGDSTREEEVKQILKALLPKGKEKD